MSRSSSKTAKGYCCTTCSPCFRSRCASAFSLDLLQMAMPVVSVNRKARLADDIAKMIDRIMARDDLRIATKRHKKSRKDASGSASFPFLCFFVPFCGNSFSARTIFRIQHQTADIWTRTRDLFVALNSHCQQSRRERIGLSGRWEHYRREQRSLDWPAGARIDDVAVNDFPIGK